MPGVTTERSTEVPAPRAPWISLALTAAIAVGLVAVVPQRAAGAPWTVWAATFMGGLLPLFVYLSLGDPFWRPRVRGVREGVAVGVWKRTRWVTISRESSS